MSTNYDAVMKPAGASSAGRAGSDETGSRAWSGWVKPGLIGCGALLVLYTAMIWYQQVAGWAYGLDSTTPEFDTYWMGLFKFEIVAVPLLGVLGWAAIWFTRDKNLEALEPKEEIVRYMRLLGLILVYVFAVYWAASFFAEQDGAWHQTVVRDTSFTPSHIAIFYLSFPVYIMLGVASLLYAMTRLPRFAKKISVPFAIAVAGPFMMLPNVALNEWGHAFWIMEEWFTAPLHWGFSLFGWSALFLFGLAFQIGLGLTDAIKRAYGDVDQFNMPENDEEAAVQSY